MKTSLVRPARFLIVFAVILLAVAGIVFADDTAAFAFSQDECKVTLVALTQYITCWNAQRSDWVHSQVPEYLVGGGVVLSRNTGRVVWIPPRGYAVGIRQVDDDQLTVNVRRPFRVLFIRFWLTKNTTLKLNGLGQVSS